MYQLTLTKEERAAFDWVGDRYFAGEMSRLLRIECRQEPDFAEWDSDEDITFHIPESTAWFMREQAGREDFQWPCFSTGLRAKLNSFLDNTI